MSFSEVLQVLDHVYELLNARADELGINSVNYGDEAQIIVGFPAVVVTAAPVDRELHATQQFKIEYNIDIWIYHARLDETHRQRTRSDIELASKVRKVLHEDKTFGQNIIQGWVRQEVPGLMIQAKGDSVVGTRLAWTGEARVNFTEDLA